MITSYICSGTLLVFLSFTLFRVINHVHSQRLLILLLGMLFISNVFRLINVQITEIESCKKVNIVSLNTVLAVTTYFEYTPRNLTYWILASKYYQLSSSVYSLMNGGSHCVESNRNSSHLQPAVVALASGPAVTVFDACICLLVTA